MRLLTSANSLLSTLMTWSKEISTNSKNLAFLNNAFSWDTIITVAKENQISKLSNPSCLRLIKPKPKEQPRNHFRLTHFFTILEICHILASWVNQEQRQEEAQIEITGVFKTNTIIRRWIGQKQPKAQYSIVQTEIEEKSTHQS